MTDTSLSFVLDAGTDVGRVRTGNEDSYYAGTAVMAVADGMGGHAGGEIASRRALGPIERLEGASHPAAEAASEALAEAIAEANRIVLEHGQANPELSGMGTTLTAAMIRQDRLHVAHVGDSRAYLLRDAQLTQLTSDHTLVEQMVRDGRISRAEAAVHPHRSVLTRAIGIEHGIAVDTPPPVPLQPGDKVLLCSDGLTGQVDEGELARLLGQHDEGAAAVAALIEAANAAGGPDNITVVLLQVGPADQTPATTAASDGNAQDTTHLAVHDDAAAGQRGQQPINTRSISTVPAHTDEDWVHQFNRYGEPQGATGNGEVGRRRSLRAIAVLLAVAVLLGLMAAGGYALLSQAYFVGNQDGKIVIFHGIPQSVVGIDLHWPADTTGLSVDALPEHLQQRLIEQGGVTTSSLADAQQVVDDYERIIQEAQQGGDAQPGARDSSGDSSSSDSASGADGQAEQGSQ